MKGYKVTKGKAAETNFKVLTKLVSNRTGRAKPKTFRKGSRHAGQLAPKKPRKFLKEY